MIANTARHFEPSLIDGNCVRVAGVDLVLHPSGALYWPAERVIVVADLHFEKGSSYARRGVMLPPYDTAVTLAALGDAIRTFDPLAVVALGDSFHDVDGPSRLPPAYRGELARLQNNREWVWIAGNHDPDLPADLGGDRISEIDCGGLIFRHEPVLGAVNGEIAGHMHPAAKLRVRGRSLRRRCFVTDGERMILPAFGSFTGGLNVCDRAWEPLIARRGMSVHLLGKGRIYPVAASDLKPD